MAKAQKKKPPKRPGMGNVGVHGKPNPTFGQKVGHTLGAWAVAAYLRPTIAHVASLPGRLGIGFDDEPLAPASQAKKKLPRATLLPPAGKNPQPNRPGAPPIHSAPKPTVYPAAKPVVNPPAKAPTKMDISRAGNMIGPISRTRTAIGGGIGAALIGPALGIPAGMIVGSRPMTYTRSKENDQLEEAGRLPYSEHLGRGLVELGKRTNQAGKAAYERAIVPAAKNIGSTVANLGRSAWNRTEGYRKAVGQNFKDIGSSIGEDIQKLRDKFGFDNEEFLTPSSRRATNKLSPGRALMTSLRAANKETNNQLKELLSKLKVEEPIMIYDDDQGANRVVKKEGENVGTSPASPYGPMGSPSYRGKKPTHKKPPSDLQMANEQKQVGSNKALHEAAFQALKQNDIATALGIVGLEQEPESQSQAVGQANGVPRPIRGRIQESMTRHNRAEVGKMGKYMDQIPQGMSPQNPVGMDADENLAMVPSPQRAVKPPLSPGQSILKNFRERNALKERMNRAANFDGENMEGLEMANSTTCDVCCCSPCCCTMPSSSRANSQKVTKELHKDKVMRQKMERALQPMPAPDTHQDRSLWG